MRLDSQKDEGSPASVGQESWLNCDADHHRRNKIKERKNMESKSN